MTTLFHPSSSGPSLGRMCAGDVEIKAFGPQSLPLSDRLKDFGIKGSLSEGWACCLGRCELWLEVKTHTRERECKLDFRFVGLDPEIPFGLVFYAKGQSCSVGSEQLKPKSLRRFQGETSQIDLHNCLQIHTLQPQKVQVIPLAGEDSFWQAEFLICYEIQAFAPQVTFLLKLTH